MPWALVALQSVEACQISIKRLLGSGTSLEGGLAPFRAYGLGQNGCPSFSFGESAQALEVSWGSAGNKGPLHRRLALTRTPFCAERSAVPCPDRGSSSSGPPV